MNTFLAILFSITINPIFFLFNPFSLDNFKFLLQEAEKINIYTPVDYKKKPQKYCSMEITDNPYFDPSQSIRVIFIYLGNNDIIEGNLPITKNIIAGKFSVKIKILKSKVRGAVIVQYQNCKI